jgi:protein subunit release factor B
VVRSYVRYKRNYVEDPRTGLRTGKIQNVLRGDLDAFLQAWLRQRSAPEPESG